MKRFLCLLVAGVVSISVCTSGVWAATDKQIEAGNNLKALQLMSGYEDGTMRLDNNITRAEMANLLVRVLGYEGTNVPGAEKANFKDLPKGYWGTAGIQNAAALGLVTGYEDGTFRPNQPITFAESNALMIRALQYDKNLTGGWPDNYLNKSKELGIIAKDNQVNPSKVVTRGEVAEILWNTLLVKLPE